jgi:YebC/PmpR family DNA-binding regulatory protein
VKSGGGMDPESNPKLREAIDTARASNMSKETIDRAISKAGGEGISLEEVSYEGFGPEGINLIIEVATDNRNRTSQEIKNLLERQGGSLGSPGSASFNFETKGFILIEKEKDASMQMLSLIDLGVEDLDEVEDAIEAYVNPHELSEKKELIRSKGFKVIRAETIKRPKNTIEVSDIDKAKKILHLLDTLEDSDDVQKVYANVDIPEEILKRLSAQ